MVISHVPSWQSGWDPGICLSAYYDGQQILPSASGLWSMWWACNVWAHHMMWLKMNTQYVGILSIIRCGDLHRTHHMTQTMVHARTWSTTCDKLHCFGQITWHRHQLVWCCRATRSACRPCISDHFPVDLVYWCMSSLESLALEGGRRRTSIRLTDSRSSPQGIAHSLGFGFVWMRSLYLHLPKPSVSQVHALIVEKPISHPHGHSSNSETHSQAKSGIPDICEPPWTFKMCEWWEQGLRLRLWWKWANSEMKYHIQY